MCFAGDSRGGVARLPMQGASATLSSCAVGAARWVAVMATTRASHNNTEGGDNR